MKKQPKKKKFTTTQIGGAIILVAALIPAILNFSSSASGHSSGADLQWVSFDQGVAKAKAENKKLLIDVYTDWCTWCKKMDSDTYTAKAVQAEIQKHFVPVKLNAESPATINYNGEQMTQIQFSQASGVDGYPATLFMDESQKAITLVPGFIQPDRFATILRYIGEDHYKTTPFQQYLSGKPSMN